MKDLAGKQVSNEVYELINKAVMVAVDAPYKFKVYGVHCYGGARNNADVRFEKLKKWVERNHAQITVLDRPLPHVIEIEITDPVAVYLEKYITQRDKLTCFY